ncbi:MAG: hypothetical protein ACRCT8_11700 [Lacipirellulaceae bacterium]
MSLKSFACVAALCVLAASQAVAQPVLTFVNNADSTGKFTITPTGASVGDPDSLAFEIVVTVTAGGNGAATVGALFPTANPGGTAPITGGTWNGLTGSGTTTIRAAFGSNLFTSAAPVDALTIDLAGAGSISWQAVLAQDAVLTSLLTGTGNITAAAGTVLGDTNADGAVNLTDLNNVKNNFGLASPPAVGDARGAIDGIINLADLNAVKNNFGQTNPGATSIPEPSALILGLVAVAGLARRRA